MLVRHMHNLDQTYEYLSARYALDVDYVKAF